MATTSFTDLVTLTSAAWFNYVDSAAYAYLTGVSGTNTIAATGPASMTAYAAGQRVFFIPANTNTAAATLNVTPSGGSALGAKNLFNKGVAVRSGELITGIMYEAVYDGTQYQVLGLTTPRIGSTTSHATPTINTDLYDVYRLTAQAEAITSFTTNLSGTPGHDQALLIEITGTAARAITWGASFEASTVALPTTTVTTAMLSVAFLYNSATSKWRCMGTV